VIDAAGHVLVTDSGNHRVQVFTKTGDFMATFGGEGSQAGRFRSPHGITVGPNGWLFVADRDNHRVQILRSEGSPIAVIDHATDGSGFIPLGLCFTPEGDLVASDSKGHRLLRWPAGWIRERAISG
jgi:tripartite motif-containing protein 71